MRTGSLLVLAKEPRPGRVKTRLVPPLTHDDAARLAAAALLDTVDAVSRTRARRRVLAFEGDARRWRPPGWTAVPQPAGGLDERIVAAFAAVSGPALLVGMDTPQLTPNHLEAFAPRRFDAALGRAPDGGYWAIGLADARWAAAAVLGVPMSTEETGAAQLARLRRLGLRVQLLDELTDVDTIGTAAEVAAAAPRTRFAAAFAATPVPA